MVIKQVNEATGAVTDLGGHHGRLRMLPGDRSITFSFDFAKKKSVDSVQQDRALIWERLMIHPYSDIPGKMPSEIVDVADEYMFKIRGFGKEIMYEVWPKNSLADADLRRSPLYEKRSPLYEKKKWMDMFRKAYSELEKYNESTGKGDPIPINIKYNGYPLKGRKTVSDDTDRRFNEFHGTIVKAIFAQKKSPSKLFRNGYDNRLLELLVGDKGGQPNTIMRYRTDEHSTEISGFIDLGAVDSKDKFEDVFPKTGNIPPTAPKVNPDSAVGKKGRVTPGKAGTLTFVFKDRRRSGKRRHYEFKIPGSRGGADFYESTMRYADAPEADEESDTDGPSVFANEAVANLAAGGEIS